MQKNGFVFIETIVAIVVLTSSLLLLYSSFNKVLQLEKTRVYYDDVNYIYRSHYIKNRLDKLNLSVVLKDLTSEKNDEITDFFITVGTEYDGLFNGYEEEKVYIENLLGDFEVNQIIILKENKIDDLKKCTLECSLDKNCANYENCNKIYTNLSDEMVSYLNSIYIDVSCTYVMAVEYRTCNNSICRNYYSWVSV